MRTWVFGLCLLFVSASGLGQSTATESQGIQALVAEVRQLRKDLQATNGYAIKAGLQVQEGTVARVSQSLNDLHSGIALTQERQRNLIATIKQFERS